MNFNLSKKERSLKEFSYMLKITEHDAKKATTNMLIVEAKTHKTKGMGKGKGKGKVKFKSKPQSQK